MITLKCSHFPKAHDFIVKVKVRFILFAKSAEQFLADISKRLLAIEMFIDRLSTKLHDTSFLKSSCYDADTYNATNNFRI